MPNITQRTNKDGSVSFRIRVFVDANGEGKQAVKSMTWTPPPGMRPSTAEKEANRQALLFEDSVRRGLVSIDGKTKFADYADRWLEAADIAPKSREQYLWLMVRTRQAIGHIPLEKLRAEHLETFYANLRETGINQRSMTITAPGLAAEMKKRRLTQAALSKKTGLALNTVAAACAGQSVAPKTAQKIAEALGKDPFTRENTGTLSDTSIRHYHTMIRAILATAKRQRIIPFNVAADHMDAPKTAKKEATFLNDDEAKDFLSALVDEPDIRVKTSLILALFTGMRRGELCGLAWPDVDFENHIISVKRASQYLAGQGVVETPTKTESSIRDIDVPAFVTQTLREYRIWWLERRLMWGAEWKGEAQRLFTQDDGRPINPETINFWLQRFLRKNGLPSITPHSLRHTFATLQIAAGVDLRTVQARTGHSQASTLLNVYSHAIKTAQKKAVQALDDVLLRDLKTSG